MDAMLMYFDCHITGDQVKWTALPDGPSDAKT